jgi:hypothetical protein
MATAQHATEETSHESCPQPPLESRGARGGLIKPSEKPKFIYSFGMGRAISKTALRNGEASNVRTQLSTVNIHCSWAEAAGEKLFLTGGYDIDRVVCIELQREAAAVNKAPMQLARSNHFSLYSQGFLYVVGGYRSNSPLKECERYDLAKDQWESIASLPIPCRGASLVEDCQKVYAMGGFNGDWLNSVQVLCLRSLMWEVLLLTLPFKSDNIPCFTVGAGTVYIVMAKDLFKVQASHGTVELVKTLPEYISSTYGPSYYSEGYLYCTSFAGAAHKVVVGELD